MDLSVRRSDLPRGVHDDVRVEPAVAAVQSRLGETAEREPQAVFRGELAVPTEERSVQRLHHRERVRALHADERETLGEEEHRAPPVFRLRAQVSHDLEVLLDVRRGAHLPDRDAGDVGRHRRPHRSRGAANAASADTRGDARVERLRSAERARGTRHASPRVRLGWG